MPHRRDNAEERIARLELLMEEYRVKNDALADAVLKTNNQSLISRLQAGRTVDEYWSAIKGVPGLKVTLEREVAIEFEPEW